MPKRSTLRLTKRIVERLKADGKDAIFWDRDLAGFGVRVHATGRKLYIVQSRGPAGLKRVTLGPVDGETIEARRREAAEVIDRIKRGEDPRPAPEPTVADLAERFLGNHVEVRCKPNTAKSYREVLHNHVLPTLGKKPVGNVVPEDVAALHHRLRDRPSVANLAVWVLSRMYVLAEAWGMAPPGRNPCRHARYYRNKSRERFLTPEEFRLLGAALRRFEAEGSMMPSAIAAVRLLMLTGCRSDEVLSLTWDDVDRTARVLRLRDAKTGPRMVPLTGPVLKVLDGIERAEGVPWVFRGARAGSRLACLSWHWRRIKEETGLRDVRVHDLRHSYASRALALGESLPTIGRLLGHARVGTTAKYAHLVRDAEKAAAARTGDSIGAHILPGRAEAA
ncbi:MAG: tyrosine-type recombinase/integrase [Rhodospirillaceae bacterium]|nr:tyrosine-type recombinase/integrase [Rhodospirillaceae bacterium]MDE0617536.1 tyrosine-type recombinase/integrase [Rhodospirillaceae bacterium]